MTPSSVVPVHARFNTVATKMPDAIGQDLCSRATSLKGESQGRVAHFGERDRVRGDEKNFWEQGFYRAEPSRLDAAYMKVSASY